MTFSYDYNSYSTNKTVFNAFVSKAPSLLLTGFFWVQGLQSGQEDGMGFFKITDFEIWFVCEGLKESVTASEYVKRCSFEILWQTLVYSFIYIGNLIPLPIISNPWPSYYCCMSKRSERYPITLRITKENFRLWVWPW